MVMLFRDCMPLGRVLVRNVAMVFDPYLRTPQKPGGQTFSNTI